MFRLFVLMVSLIAVPARACDLALVLAVDVSGSVDAREYQIQMQGLAAGLQDGIVIDALIDAEAMVTLIQWTGSSRQRQTIPWQQMNTDLTLLLLRRQSARTKECGGTTQRPSERLL